MDKQHALDILRRLNAVITNSHIVYASGKHGTAYVNKDAIYPHTRETSALCFDIADYFSEDGVQVVVAPAVGGVILSQGVAYHLTKFTGHDVFGVYAEKDLASFRHPDSIGSLDTPIQLAYEDTGRFVIKRGYDKLVRGKKVLVVEDVLNTGGSVHKVVRAVRTVGGDVIGVGAICNRGGVTRHTIGDVPDLYSILDVEMDAWDEADCPMCKQGVPINTDVGHGREFLADKRDPF